MISTTSSKKMNNLSILLAIPLLATLVVIFYFSAQPAPLSENTSWVVVDWLSENCGVSVKVETARVAAHFTEYVLLGFLVTAYSFSRRKYLRPFYCAGLTWAYAWSDEIHQYFVPGRVFQLFDLAVDLCGSITGVLLFTVPAVIIVFSHKKSGISE